MPSQKIRRLADHIGGNFPHPAHALHLDFVLGRHGSPEDRDARFSHQLELRERLLQPRESGISPPGVQDSV